jgi:inosose dehydratase
MSWAAANLAGVLTEPPKWLPDLRAVIEAVEALNRPIFGIVEQDMYPVAFDVPMPIAKRTRNYLLSCGSRTAVS